MSIVDLIDRAIDDCAVSDDAVRYNPPPDRHALDRWMSLDEAQQIVHQSAPHGNVYIRVASRPVGATWEQLQVVDNVRRARMRRLHTAYPRRWRKP